MPRHVSTDEHRGRVSPPSRKGNYLSIIKSHGNTLHVHLPLPRLLRERTVQNVIRTANYPLSLSLLAICEADSMVPSAARHPVQAMREITFTPAYLDMHG